MPASARGKDLSRPLGSEVPARRQGESEEGGKEGRNGGREGGRDGLMNE